MPIVFIWDGLDFIETISFPGILTKISCKYFDWIKRKQAYSSKVKILFHLTLCKRSASPSSDIQINKAFPTT